MTCRPIFWLSAALAVAACGKTTPNETTSSVSPPLLKQLRIGMLAPSTEECRTDAPDWSAGQRQYVQHLKARMAVPVSLCPMADYAAIAAALAQGRIDLGPTDQRAFAAVRTKIRPILAVRPDTPPGRAIMVIVVPEAAPMRSLAKLLPTAVSTGARLIESNENADMLAGVRRILAAAGFSPAQVSAASVAPNAGAAVGALRARAGDALAVGAAEWFRYCRGTKQAETPCAGLREIWRGREPVTVAWSVTRTIAPESWARLVGIHVALFLEQPAAAAWLAPGGREITPVEATALDPIGR